MGNARLETTCQVSVQSSVLNRQSKYDDEVAMMIGLFRKKYAYSLKQLEEMVIDENTVCRGEFFKGKLNGYGEITSGGSVCVGTFSSGLPHGQAIIINNSKQYIRGTFKKGHLSGHGYEQALDFSFEGTFEEGERKQGILKTCSYTYEGTFEDNSFSGHGRLVYQTGEKYEGEFKRGNFHGLGTYSTYNGVYTGMFRKGLYHGLGVYQWQNGAIYEGEYQQGIRNGFGILTDGETCLQTYWSDGQPVPNKP